MVWNSRCDYRIYQQLTQLLILAIVGPLNQLNNIPLEHWFRRMFDHQIKIKKYIINNITESYKVGLGNIKACYLLCY